MNECIVVRSAALEAFDSTYLRAFATSTTTGSLHIIGVGADSYDWEVHDSVAFDSLVTSGNSLISGSVPLTGLVAGTQYYARVKAKKTGFADSGWAESGFKTLPYVPLAYWNFQGIGYDQTNEFGKTGAPNTATQAAEVYSIFGSPSNTLTPVGIKGVIACQINGNEKNIQQATTTFQNNQEYAPTTPITLNGDFTLIFRLAKNNLNSFFNIVVNYDGLQFIRFTGVNSTQYKSSVGAVRTLSFLSPIGAYDESVVVFKRVGTTLYLSGDGGQTYNSIAGDAGTITVNKLFPTSNKFVVSTFGLFSQDLTTAEIAQYAYPEYQSDRVRPAEVLSPKNLTFNALSGDYYVDSTMLLDGTAGLYRKRWKVRGDYMYGIITVSPNMDGKNQEKLLVYQFSTNKIAVGDITPYPVERVQDDSHDQGSIYLMEDKVMVSLVSDHYDNTIPITTLIFHESGPGINLAHLTQVPKGNGFVSAHGGMTQYQSMIKSTNYDIVMSQEWYGGQGARWCSAFLSKDGFNSFEKKIRVASTNSTDWFYILPIYSEDGNIWFILNLITANVRYKGSYLLKTPDEFNTIQSPDGVSLSQTIVGDVDPVAIATIQATPDCVLIDGTSTTNSTMMFRAFLDPTDNEIYGVGTDGTGTGLYLVRYRSGVITRTPIDFGAHAIDTSIYTGDPNYTGHGVNVPFAIRRGATTYDVYCERFFDVSTLEIVRFRTIDDGATWSYVGVISNDTTKSHRRMDVADNIHYTGTTAYNGNIALVASRNDVANADLFIKNIS